MADPIRLERMENGRFQVQQGPLKWPFNSTPAGEYYKVPRERMKLPPPTEEETMMLLGVLSVPAPDEEEKGK